MMNSSNVFPTVVALNYNQQSIIACQIGVLEGNPFRRYGLGSLVFIVSNTQLSINQCNVNHDLLQLKVSAISYNPEFLADESRI